MADNQGLFGFRSPDENVDFPSIAKEVVFRLVDMELKALDRPGEFTRDEVFIVWFCKTLQNWKALVSTGFPDGRYYEVIYSGDKQEIYVDVYVKIVNQVVMVEDILGDDGKRY